jgi:molecular chaperone DnaK
MKNEAKANEATDKVERERVDKLNQADALVFQTEKQLKEYGDKISQDKKTLIQNSVDQLKEAHKNQDIAAVDAAMISLNNAWTAASEEIYKAQSQGAGQSTGGEQSTGNGDQQQTGAAGENVQDVPYEEVK